ncbi:hypothetical protein [Chromobacterium vaccinii]|uniref:hypothetical protein n=1 Tax=Chromobacterium vaccinii TaxID=1108595 RepID=UPI000AC426C3|nr:hypothetical protein [Chromobacterium vaccinii]
MDKKYTIMEITAQMDDVEQVGTKEKYWFNFNSKPWLLKLSRELSGEHWAEKAAEQVCELIQLPHARYELAKHYDKIGIASESFLPDDKYSLILGNELLVSLHDDYPKLAGPSKFLKTKDHNIYRVLAALKSDSIKAPLGLADATSMSACEVFTGYLMLDAFIGNQDRHDENWALIQDNTTGNRYLAPTFDHASGFACTERDEKRISRLKTNDKGYSVEAFARKSRSGLYRSQTDKKTLGTVDAFRIAASKNKEAAIFWLDKLAKINDEKIMEILKMMPDEIISDPAILFSTRMLVENRRELLCTTLHK